ncbi:histidine kinase [Salinimicrobium soli]|uniref:histidine kinase n=1 Tax=Salinimicrobium soli TaxID=1254399 RepID=UPI003AABB940
MRILIKILKISAIICVVVVLLNLVFGGIIFPDLADLKMWGIYFFYCFVLTFVNVVYFAIFDKKIGWEDATLQRVFFAAAGSIILTLVAFFFCRLVDETLFQGTGVEEFLQNERAQYYLFPLLFTTIVSLVFHLIYFYKALQERKVTEQKIIAGTASAKFESLKNQIDPHFLFNSLNVLSSLIDEDQEKAQKFTTSLSKIYRYVLEQKDKELVSLEEELSFAVTYMNLLKMRFENSLFYEVPQQLNLPEAKVVPLSLQLLLENTVKHNVLSEKRPLKIRIFEENGYLVVENNFQKKEVLGNRKGVGLQNIVERYGLVTQRKVFIQQNAEYFRVKLPLLTKQLKVMDNIDNTITDDAYLRAQRRVKELKNFYGSLITYCLVIPFLAFINYKTYWGFQWFWFPLLGWGMGLAIHGFSIFKYGREWEERKIRDLMAKDREQNKTWN